MTSHFVSCDKFEHDIVDSNFSKVTVIPKIKVKLPIMTEQLTLPGLIARHMSVSRLQNVESVSRYTASDHLEKFAVDSTLSTSSKITAI